MTHYLAGAILVAGLLFPAAVSADDRHAGYYYPEPGSEET